MSQTISIELALQDRERLAELSRLAGVSERKYLEDLVENALSAAERKRRAAAKTGEAVDERLLSRWRVIVAEALDGATSWTDLQARLARRGVRYAPAGGGLELQDRTGRRLAKGSVVGPSYARLVARFAAPFPGHPHLWIADRVLGRREERGAP